MLYFWHSKQNDGNRSHFRGLLFEDLLRTFLRKLGYKVEVARKKHNSLEYDIEGTASLDGRKVVGEAKAHEHTIPAQDLSAFVGKLLPLARRHPHLTGLFFATSALSPDAEDYFEELSKGDHGFSVSRMTGQTLESEVARALSLPSVDAAAQITRIAIPAAAANHTLHTDRGTFIAVIGRSTAGVLPDRFALIDANGASVDDHTFLSGVRSSLEGFRELEPITDTSHAAPTLKARTISAGLILANDWLDYRRPAASAFFVGREAELAKLKEFGTTVGAPPILEIKARSGVGKSSLLAVLAEHWTTHGHRVELHDARDVHAATDVFALIDRFTNAVTPVRSFEDVPTALKHLTSASAGGRSFFMIDQFESTLANQEVFNAYEYLALAIARANTGITLAFGRKDDLLTTYDDIKVDIFRLRQLATTIVLEDLSREDAANLLRAASDAHSTRVHRNVLNSVLEFAKGFPWLLKRTLAHVVQMLSRGVTQKDLLSAGLQLEELFEEELNSLDEIERGYLQRLAGHLPATYQALLQKYENDPLLPKILERLTERRLLRLSGSTYDVYNDVFKEYIVYARLPEESASFLMKRGPGSVMSSFRQLRGRSPFAADGLAKELGKPVGSVHNALRELRLLGLIFRSAGGWEIPEVVRQYEHQSRLGEFLRQSMLRNASVTELLSTLERIGSLRQAEVRRYLKEQFAFVGASNQVWVAYTRTFVSWLRHLKFVRMDRAGTIYPLTSEREAVVRTLGNLPITTRGSRSSDVAFLPTRRLNPYLKMLTAASTSQLRARSGRRMPDSIIRDLERLQAVTVTAEGIVRPLMDTSTFELHCRELLGSEPYKRFWICVSNSIPYARAIQECFDLRGLSPVTLEAFGVMLVNWGKHFCMLPPGRYRRSATRESASAFDQTLFD